MNSLRGQKLFSIAHASEVSAARRYSAELADQAGLDATEAGRLAIIVTEAATNMLKHAQDGMLLLNAASVDGADGVDVLALDRGPGIANLGQSLRDGISTAGTAGTGLGAMRRQADEFDAHTMPGRGSAFYMRVRHAPGDHAVSVRDPFAIGAVCQPVAGEDECGDAWSVSLHGGDASVLVADGLGHGPEAARASAAGVHAMHGREGLAPAALMQELHHALRPTRGAAAAVLQIRPAGAHLHFAGIGNIAACVIDSGARRQLVSHNGIVGHNMRKVQEFSVAWQPASLCVLCSDGITTHWDLDAYPGLASCHPALVAGTIFRDFLRGRDDATVLVIRQRQAG